MGMVNDGVPIACPDDFFLSNFRGEEHYESNFYSVLAFTLFPSHFYLSFHPTGP